MGVVPVNENNCCIIADENLHEGVYMRVVSSCKKF